MKIFVIVDSCDSWAGEIKIYGAYKSKERALEVLESLFHIPRKLYGFYDFICNFNLDERGIKELIMKTFGDTISVDSRSWSAEEAAEHIYYDGLKDWWDNVAGLDIKEVELEDE